MGKNMKTKLMGILSLSLCLNAQALILPEMDKNLEQTAKEMNLEFVDAKYSFEGIVKLSNCSGSIIKLSGQPNTAPAIMMTNGHCIKNPGGFLKPGEVVVNRESNMRSKVFDKKMRLYNIQASKLLYATMTNTDVAYYELKQTYQEIENMGIEPLTLDSTMPIIGTDIDIISGYWERGYRCHIDGLVFALLEGDWTFTNSLRYSEKGCETIGGTSGSPIIQTDSRTVVGINNTGNRDGGRCEINNPCEQDDNGDINVMLRSYGQQTYNLYNCLTPDFQIDLEMASCDLPK